MYEFTFVTGIDETDTVLIEADDYYIALAKLKCILFHKRRFDDKHLVYLDVTYLDIQDVLYEK